MFTSLTCVLEGRCDYFLFLFLGLFYWDYLGSMGFLSSGFFELLGIFYDYCLDSYCFLLGFLGLAGLY